MPDPVDRAARDIAERLQQLEHELGMPVDAICIERIDVFPAPGPGVVRRKVVRIEVTRPAFEAWHALERP